MLLPSSGCASNRCCLFLFCVVHSVCAFSSWITGSNEHQIDPSNNVASLVVNRELEASVKAHDWPFLVDNIYCEAWAYHDLKDWDFMDRLVSRMSEVSDLITKDLQEAINIVLQATQTNPSLLQYSLSLRAYSPLCEMHRTLARQLVLSNPALLSHEAFCVLDQNHIVSTPTDLAALLQVAGKKNEDNVEELLPGEYPRGEVGSLIVLYANMGSVLFQQFYNCLVESNHRFVVRHRGHVAFEEVGGHSTVLQGYGVRLDIRNVEYRSFDDGSTGKANETSQLEEMTMYGVTYHTMAKSQITELKGFKETNTTKFQEDLWRLHFSQQIHSQLVPTKEQRKYLALQAAIVISRAPDVLLTLQDISQNLPSVAYTLTQVEVTKDVQALSEIMEPLIRRSKGVLLTINGRIVPVGRPSFNVFELLQMLKEEQQALDDMQLELNSYLPVSGLQQVQKAWAMGKEFFSGSKPSEDLDEDAEEDTGMSGNARRIDVGRGWKKAIVYVNDLEKDLIYREWPRSVRQAMMSLQFGAPPAVRRNLFTLLCVIDPIEKGSTEHPGFNLGNQLVQAHYPARIGYLIVSNKDLKQCLTWIDANGVVDEDVPCPTQRIVRKDQSSMDALAQVEGSTHAVHRLVTKIATDYAGQGVAISFMEYFVQSLDYFLDDERVLSMMDIVTAFGQVMEALFGMKMKDAINMAFKALLQDDEDLVASYGKSLRFAINKSISSGMGFINGRPLPQGKRADPGETFAQEQNHVFSLIMRGEITDSSPKSVYGKLLQGDGVFNRLHPLLLEAENDKHLDLAHKFSSSSLLLPESHSTDYAHEAVFIAEAVVDLGTSEGLSFAAAFANIMNAYTRELKTGQIFSPVLIGYRIVPSPGSRSIPACSLLAHGAFIGFSGIKRLFAEGDLATKTIDDLMLLFPTLSDETKEAIENFSCSKWSLDSSMPAKNFVAVNGKVYAPETGMITKDDIDLLIELERDRSVATTKLLSGIVHLDDVASIESVVKATKFLSMQLEKDDTSRRMDMMNQALALEKDGDITVNPFRFSWNVFDQDALRVKASIVLDPATEGAQRVAPLLRVFRDLLKIPLDLILVPQTLLNDDDANVPITSYYRFVADPQAMPDSNPPKAKFSNLPTNHILTLRLDVPESWNVQQTHSMQDTDNLRCSIQTGCGDDRSDREHINDIPVHEQLHLTTVEYGLKSLMFFGQCYDASTLSPPNGLQLILSRKQNPSAIDHGKAEVSSDGFIEVFPSSPTPNVYSDTLVMKNVGYWQLRSNPGVWQLQIAPSSRGAEIFDIVDGTVERGSIQISKTKMSNSATTIYMKDFIGKSEMLLVNPRTGFEKASLFDENATTVTADNDDVIHVFSLATGHLYERFLKIMMLSVTKRTSTKVKFWLFENFLSPSFKGSAKAMADRIGCDLEFVTYKWPEWLRGQSEKQRIIWGYKILFLDVLFPLSVKKIIYVDADQVVRGDLKELWDMDLKGAPYGYTPMCSSRESTLGFQFWRGGFWEQHLRGKPYHISALYVVDLDKFRQHLVGDNLRAVYQQLSADPNSLANLDQDLPNYAQHQVPIFSLPQEWLWCESWCSDETKATAKTIDLCNNPLHKEPKVNMAKRIISGPLFEESWVELDAEVESYEKEYLDSLAT